MQRQWSDLLRTSGDASIGQTLLRLADMSRAAHQHAQLEQLRAGADADAATPLDLTQPPQWRQHLRADDADLVEAPR